MADILSARQAGLLLPLSALPSRHGIGDMGETARALVAMLAHAGVRVWQILPLNPLGFGNSPYQPYSSFAGDPIYLSLDDLGVAAPAFRENEPRVDYEAVRAFKEPYLREAFARFQPDEAYAVFVGQAWVREYAIFATFKKHNGMRCWNEWPDAMKHYPEDPALLLDDYEEDIRYEMFLQYAFFQQWSALKEAANLAGIHVMGDIPFYVGIDSQDVWAGKANFLLDEAGQPTYIAGVPPDYFSKTGQRWGNPIYNWAHMEKTGFAFWLERLRYSSVLFDIIRIDHFRAFDTYWKIPASCPTAEIGEWVEAPGYAFFDRVREALPGATIVAEDLGDLRPEVHALRDHYGLMGMKIVQFCIQPGQPIAHTADEKENTVIYTGTHDNQTMRGYCQSRTSRERIALYRALRRSGYWFGSLPSRFVRYALDDRARLAIIPAQDLLEYDDSARLNTPGTVGSPNWEWKLAGNSALDALRRRLQWYGRMLHKTRRK